MGPFVSSHGMKHIFLAVDYVSKWIKLSHLRIIKGRLSSYS